MRFSLSIPTAAVATAALLVVGCGRLEPGPEPEPPPKPGFGGYTGEPGFTAAAGDTVTTTFTWAQRLSRDPQRPPSEPPTEPKFVWCIVAGGGTVPGGADECHAFDSTSCAVSDGADIFATRSCTGDVTLPGGLAGKKGLWYIRAEHPADPAAYTNSNALDFSWTVPPR